MDSKGSILIGLIVTLTLLASLSAGVLVLTNSSTFTPVSGQGARQAYYLAEAGYRFGAMMYLSQTTEAAKDAILNDLHGKTLAMGSTGSFTLSLSSYFFRTASAASANSRSLSVRTYGAWPADLVLPTNGRVQVVSNDGSEVYGLFNYTAVTESAGTRILTLQGNHPDIPQGINVFPVVTLATEQTLQEGGTLVLSSGMGAYFSQRNGLLIAAGRTIGYTQKNGDTLTGLRDPYKSSDPNYVSPFGQVLPSGSDIIPGKFIFYESTGFMGDGAFAARRTVRYHVPIGYLSSLTQGQHVKWHDRMNTPENWLTPSTASSSGLGNWLTAVMGDAVTGFSFASEGGDQAMRMGSASSSRLYNLAYASINPGSTAGGVPNLAWSWWYNDKKLNYDAQVKLKITDGAPYYASGISFRADKDGNSYGMSLLQGRRGSSWWWGDVDGIPDGLTPVSNRPLLVLWKQVRNGSTLNWQWLAYKALTPDITGSLFFDDAEDEDTFTQDWSLSGSGKSWGRVPVAYEGGEPTDYAYTDSPSGNYNNNSDTRLTSRVLDLSGVSSATLQFRQWYDIEPRHWLWGTWYDWGAVEISTNGGSSWTRIARFAGSSGGWVNATYDLSAHLPSSNFRIRFRLQSDGSVVRDGWYIDDISIIQPAEWQTLLVRVEEKKDPEDATRLVNDIQLMIASQSGKGTASSSFTDMERLPHPRGTQKWPPINLADTTAETDYFTLMVWDQTNLIGTLGSTARLAGTGAYAGTIIRDRDERFLSSTYTSPKNFAENRPELGLHAWGLNSSSTWFDDFGIQLGSGVAGGQAGFLPPIQE
ncbi:immune inhibitor A domain-containing protein [Desulfobotulus sp.]|uniref:immune inhibitor A domain-containing protein n=1 Tax=Desulfobotulus sp. TaxID=1940337 RepID=UPI002A36CA32|nr:immune inhibitor A domain-containing protein [Desulfobotulus sp.]MDY0163065.1 immune inhibitor A [Desulfobotulus sp.]